MTYKADPQIEALLTSVNSSVKKLDEIESNYIKSKEDCLNEINSFLKELAVRSDTQASRAVVIREIYWKTDIPVTVLQEAFGLTPGRIRNLAGEFIVEVPCVNECGNILKEVFTTKTMLRQRVVDKDSIYLFRKCDVCSKKERIEEEQAEINARRAFIRRNAELRNMSWEDYTETREWTYIRNFSLHKLGYKCEICEDKFITLYIYPHKDTPQSSYEAFPDTVYKYYVLCGKCIIRCEGLINPEKRDLIKKDFIPAIQAWVQKGDYQKWHFPTVYP